MNYNIPIKFKLYRYRLCTRLYYREIRNSRYKNKENNVKNVCNFR